MFLYRIFCDTQSIDVVEQKPTNTWLMLVTSCPASLSSSLALLLFILYSFFYCMLMHFKLFSLTPHLPSQFYTVTLPFLVGLDSLKAFKLQRKQSSWVNLTSNLIVDIYYTIITICNDYYFYRVKVPTFCLYDLSARWHLCFVALYLRPQFAAILLPTLIRLKRCITVFFLLHLQVSSNSFFLSSW